MRPQQFRIVPIGPPATTLTERQRMVDNNARRLEVLRNCVNFIFENKISDGRIVSFDGRIVSFEGRIVSFEDRMVSFDGRIVSFDGRIASFDGRIVSFEGRIVNFEGRIVSFDQLNE